MSPEGHYWSFEPDPDAGPVDRATAPAGRRHLQAVRARSVLGSPSLILVTSGLGVINPLLIKEIFDKALFGARAGDGGFDPTWACCSSTSD